MSYLSKVFTLLTSNKKEEITHELINNISIDEWLAVRKNKCASKFYWDLVGFGILPDHIIYRVEMIAMEEEFSDSE